MQINNQSHTTNQARTLAPQQTQGDRPAVVFTPEADIIETPDSYVLDVYMPGVDENSADVTLENDVLSVRGRVQTTADSKLRLSYQEYEVGDYRRVFTLTENINRERVSASVRDGVLHLVLPKAEEAKPKRIEVKAA
jgi:HSP20 family molecular chaperone IbpA